MRYLPPLALTAVALTVTYLTCIRPMCRGQHPHPALGHANGQDNRAEIRRLREEVQLLQHELDLRTADPTPPQRPHR